jgi:tetratricopeptide (TPR) repeat protein
MILDKIIKSQSRVFYLYLFLGVLIYANGLNGPFMGDDHVFFEQRMGLLSNDVYFRPLAHAIPLFFHGLFGPNIFLYHAVNLVLFCLAAFCVYVFISAVFKGPLLGFLTGLLYLAHPINGIIVNYITASVFAAQVMFMLASLYFICGHSEAGGRRILRNLKILRYAQDDVLSLAFFVFSLMCHETAMALPIYAVCLLVFVKSLSWNKALRRTAWLWTFLAAYIVFHFKYASFNTTIFGQIAYLQLDFAQYLATLAKIIVWYFSKLIFLSGIVLAWSTPAVKEGLGLWLLVFVFLIAALAGGIFYFRKNKAVLLGLLWFFIGFAPVAFSCLAEPTQGFIIEPHWFVFSSLGFFLCLASALEKITFPSLRMAAIGILLFVWMMAGWGYNYLWADEERYDLYWMQAAPDFKVPRSFLARIYFNRHELERARSYYQSCMVNAYADHVFYADLGLIDYMEGHLEAAKKNFHESLSIEPRMSEAWINLGSIALKENDLYAAGDYFIKAVQADPFAVSAGLAPYEENALIKLLKAYWDKKDYQHVVPIAEVLGRYSRNPLTQRNVQIIFNTLRNQ